MFREAAYYLRMSVGVRDWVKAARFPDVDDLFRRNLEEREANFLRLARDVVFANPEHPYHQMFRLAGCGYEDLAAAVQQNGLEATLVSLMANGVHLTHDEFKGKEPIVRQGRQIPATPASFRNPLVHGLMHGSSGGSRSAGTKLPTNRYHQLYCHDVYNHFTRREFGTNDHARVVVKPILPSPAGLSNCVLATRIGKPPERWYAAGGGTRDSGHYRAVTSFLVRQARLLGVTAPLPEYLGDNDFSAAAEYIARRRAEGARVCLDGYTSPAIRVVAAARARGLDISGTLVLVSGEAVTDAKRAVVEDAGCEIYSRYWIAEVGPIGHGCRQMKTGNCLHLYRDSVAAISHRRKAPFTQVEVDSLAFTNLLPSAPLFLINVEMDDNGVVAPARCDCSFTAAGFTETLSGVYSYGKLTGAGMTLVGTEVVRLLEELLPARFGGAPGDYQLVEEEGAAQTQLTLRVSPRLSIDDPEPVKECLLHEMRRLYGGSLAARVWSHSEALRAVVAEPEMTAAAKVLSLHLLGEGKAKANAT